MSDPASVGFLIAFVAGAASFLSPCVMPLLPGYLSYMSGVSVDAVDSGEASPRRLLVPTLLFVLGFSTIFVLLGTSASLAGSMLTQNRQLVSRIGGGLIVLMGLMFMGVLSFKRLYYERRMDMRTGSTRAGNYLMGIAFGVGWTPCIGPTLGATLLLASQEQTAGRGASLLLVYSLGLGVPFVLSALGVSKLAGVLQFFRRHQKWVMRSAGAILVAFGLLLFFDRVYVISAVIQRWMMSVGLEKLVGI
ncbi:MAG: cytochrome c biogenesis protein CcdA [Actinobacteria bacterium]|nr:cytochrome c biogenesis protein CcdA [Actinomycetota bacterium]